jgi:hypothetical protein
MRGRAVTRDAGAGGGGLSNSTLVVATADGVRFLALD